MNRVFTSFAVATLAVICSAAWAAPPQNFVMHDAPKALPEISFTDGAGQPHTLGDFKGKVVLLNIWATWCAPCRKEMPTLDRLQAALGGAHFTVVALSIDRKGMGAVKKFYNEIGVTHLGLYNDPSSRILQGFG